MEYKKIEATKYSPKVELSPEGKMSIRGKSIIEDPIPFYNRIMEWIPNCQSKSFSLEIHLEYLNTSSTKVILNLLKKIKDFYNSTNITIAWYYESDDEDMLDLGKDFESFLSLPIDFYEISENAA